MNPRCSERVAPPCPCSHLCGSLARAVTAGPSRFQGQHRGAGSTLAKSRVHSSVPLASPKPASSPDRGSTYSDVPPIQNVPSSHLSSNNLAVRSQKVGTKPVPRAPLGTSSGGPNHHLHTVSMSSVAWFPSPQQTENSKIRKREISRARQIDIRRSDR